MHKQLYNHDSKYGDCEDGKGQLRLHYGRMVRLPTANTTAKPGPGTSISHPFEQLTWILAGAQAAVLLSRFPFTTFAYVNPPQPIFVVSPILSPVRYLTNRFFPKPDENVTSGTRKVIF